MKKWKRELQEFMQDVFHATQHVEVRLDALGALVRERLPHATPGAMGERVACLEKDIDTLTADITHLRAAGNAMAARLEAGSTLGGQMDARNWRSAVARSQDPAANVGSTL